MPWKLKCLFILNNDSYITIPWYKFIFLQIFLFIHFIISFQHFNYVLRFISKIISYELSLGLSPQHWIKKNSKIYWHKPERILKFFWIKVLNKFKLSPLFMLKYSQKLHSDSIFNGLCCWTLKSLFFGFKYVQLVLQRVLI